jgi:hypothetical protein
MNKFFLHFPHLCQRILHFLLLGLFFGPVHEAWAQLDMPAAEKIYIHLDKSFYVAGENLWFQAYVQPPAAESESSRVLHWDIIDANGEVKMARQSEIENGQATGDFYIPPDWPEAYYQFRAYTLWNLNFDPQPVFRQNLPIYNLLEQPLREQPGVKTSLAAGTSLETAGPYQVQIELPEKKFDRRSEIPVQLTVRDADGRSVAGQYSLKVVSESLVPQSNNDQFRLESPTRFEAQYEPERSLSFRADVYDELFQRPLESSFLVVYVVQTQKFQFSTANNGYVDVSLPDFEGEATLQLYDRGAKENYFPRITMIPPSDYIIDQDKLPLSSPPREEPYLAYLKAFANRQEYARIFDLPLILDPPKVLEMQNNLKGDRTFVTKEYIPFEDLESFIIEAMPTVKIVPILNEKLLRQLAEFEKEVAPEVVRGLDKAEDIEATQYFLKKVLPQYRNKLSDQKTLKLMEEETNQRFLGPPMFMIDSYITFDPEKPFLVNWKDVERIEMFSLNRNLGNAFGPLGFNGVFGLYTRRTEPPAIIKDDPHNISYEGFYAPRNFVETLGERNLRQPDFRGLVYWNPTVQTNAAGQAEIRIPHGDDLGSFRIHLEGMTDEGERIVAEARYEVVYSVP